MFKKFSISILILFLLSLFWLDLDSKESIIPNDNSDVPEIDNPEIIEKPLIVIDPGHGPYVNNEMEPIAPGSTQMKRKYGVGTVGNFTGTMEREVNLNVAIMLRDLLERNGYRVIMTRLDHETILSNIDRVNIANDNNADLMIRIHSDSSVNPDIHGASMLVPGDVGYASDIVDISNEYGKIILDTLVSEVGMSNRGVITRTDQTGFNWSKIPIMTVEMGFMSNPDEDQLLSTTEYQEKLANALYLGIDRCFSESNTINE
jgi:N-acetylmuramoyl-L-alanine amidase